MLNHVWLCFPGMWWPSVHWWTLRRTHRPSSFGTSWPVRKREASTARARHIGPFSSQSSLFFSFWSPPFKLSQVLNLKITEMGCFPLRWSHDGKFFARMTTDTLSIYETPVSWIAQIKSWNFTKGQYNTISFLFQSMGLLDKKSLKISGIK